MNTYHIHHTGTATVGTCLTYTYSPLSKWTSLTPAIYSNCQLPWLEGEQRSWRFHCVNDTECHILISWHDMTTSAFRWGLDLTKDRFPFALDESKWISPLPATDQGLMVFRCVNVCGGRRQGLAVEPRWANQCHSATSGLPRDAHRMTMWFCVSQVSIPRIKQWFTMIHHDLPWIYHDLPCLPSASTRF